MTTGIKFNISQADHKPAAPEPKFKDGRSSVLKMFTKFDDQTGEITPLEVKFANCAKATLAQQGLGGYEMRGKLPISLSYKSEVSDKDYSGDKKGKHLVSLGGYNGSGGLMVDVEEMPELAQLMLDLHASIHPNLAQIVKDAGINEDGTSPNAPIITVDTSPEGRAKRAEERKNKGKNKVADTKGTDKPSAVDLDDDSGDDNGNE